MTGYHTEKYWACSHRSEIARSIVAPPFLRGPVAMTRDVMKVRAVKDFARYYELGNVDRSDLMTSRVTATGPLKKGGATIGRAISLRCEHAQ